MPRPQVLIRADGDARTGLGHLVRSLALAQALAPRFELVFATRCQLPAVLSEIAAVAQLTSIPPEVSLADEVRWLAERHPSVALVVLDGYQFDEGMESALRAAGRKVVTIDDVHARPFAADLVINHAGGLSPADHQAAPYTRFALGPSYALLRPEFLAAARAPGPPGGRLDEVLICLGGADPNDDVSAVVKRALDLFGGAVLQVVLGAAYRWRDSFLAFALPHGPQIQVHTGITAPEMLGLMRRCATAILSPSGVAYEYLSVGGLLFLHPIADNQRSMFRFMIGDGLAFPFADALPDAAAVARAQLHQRAVFDGGSGGRLLDAVAALLDSGH